MSHHFAAVCHIYIRCYLAKWRRAFLTHCSRLTIYTLSMKYTAVYYNNSLNLDSCVVIFSDTNGADFVCDMMFRFDIHMSMHRNIIPKLQPTRCNISWFIYFYRRSTCFRRFLRPSSGAHNCTYSFRYCQPILLPAATVEELEFHMFQAVPLPIIRST
jgi:hypothetical protein